MSIESFKMETPKTPCAVCKKTFARLGTHLKGPCGAAAKNAVVYLPATAAPAAPVTVVPATAKAPQALSLFSGAGGDTLGIERAGYTVVAFNEFNEAAVKTHLAQFPTSVLLSHEGKTDIKKVPDAVFAPFKGAVSLVFAGFPCFVAGTRVLTNKGYLPIESVTLDHTLMTHTGKFQRIVNLQQKVYDANLYDIRIKYHPDVIAATAEHPFYVRERQRKWHAPTKKYVYSYDPPKWKPAHALAREDYFGMVVNTKSIIPTFTIVRPLNRWYEETVVVTLDSLDQWFMMGYFVGDGWVEDGRKSNGNLRHIIRFAVHNEDADVLNRLQRVLPLTDKKCSTGACDKYGCGDLVWYTILKEFGKYAHSKVIPEWVHDAPVPFVEEFLKGYAAADGSKRKNVISITTVSPHLALGAQRLHLKLGRVASVQKFVRPNTCVIQGRTVNQRDTYQICYYETEERKRCAFIEDGYAWMPLAKMGVRKTEPVPVYNFEVDVDNTYIVDNTVVHNCQGFSHAGTKKHDDPRNELVHNFATISSVIQPEWIIGENVKGLLSRKGRDPEGPKDAPLKPVIDIIVELFERTGYKVTHKLIDVSDIGVPQRRKRLILVGHRGPLYPHLPWDDLAKASTPVHTSIRGFLEPHLEGAMEVPVLYTPAEQPAHYWIPTTALAATGTPHNNLVRLVEGRRNPSSKEKAATPPVTGPIIEPAGLISYGVRKGGYHGMIVDPDKACNTIISTYNLCPRLFVGLHNATTGKYWIRCMTPRELGQIQGFPADYPWRGTEKQQIAQIGNAVPPPLAERVVRSLARVVFKTTPQRDEAAVAAGAEAGEEEDDSE